MDIKELTSRIENEYGIKKLFVELGLKNVFAKGDNIHCVCPFHDGADNPYGFAWANGFGFCFTQCRRKYTLFDVVMKVQGCSFGEAVSFLCDLIGESHLYSNKKVDVNYVLNRSFLSQSRRARAKREQPKANEVDKSIFDSIVPAMHTVLRQEGFDNDTRDHFNLGFARSGYLEDRITIPIDFTDGTIISISGRHPLSNEELKELMIPKYKVLANTDKSQTLYNISRAMPYIKESGKVIVVEGFKSVWRLRQWGFNNVVAVMGSSLSDAQRNMLLKLNCEIYVCGDRDEAGKLLNEQIKNDCGKFSNVIVFNMFSIEAEHKASPSDVSKEQFLSFF